MLMVVGHIHCSNGMADTCVPRQPAPLPAAALKPTTSFCIPKPPVNDAL